MVLAAALLAALVPAPHTEAAGFADTAGHWAEPSIAKMSLKGVLQGVAAGRFEPNRAVSRLELAVMLVRAEGHDQDARASTQAPDELVGYQQLPAWAWGYMDYALALNFLDDEDTANFRPNDAALRYQVAVMIVRALGLDSEARALTAAPNYTDAGTIPRSAWGYVSLATSKGLFKGDGGAFRPLDTVTRGEMATLLDRLDRLQDNNLDLTDVTGTVTQVFATASPRLDVRLVNGSTATVYLDQNAWVVRNGVAATIGSVRVGDVVSAVRDPAGAYGYLEADSTVIQTVTGELAAALRHVTGTLAAAFPVGSRTITVTVSGTNTHYTLATTVALRKDSRSASSDDLWVGDRVTLTLANDQVVEISATSVSRTVRGFVTSVVLSATAPAIGVTVGSNPEQVFRIRTNVPIYQGSQVISIAEVSLGNYVEITATGNTASRVAVGNKEYLEELAGVIVAVNATRQEVTVAITDQTAAPTGALRRVVRVLDSAIVVKHGSLTTFADLKVGDRVQVTGSTRGTAYTAQTVVVTFTDAK